MLRGGQGGRVGVHVNSYNRPIPNNHSFHGHLSVSLRAGPAYVDAACPRGHSGSGDSLLRRGYESRRFPPGAALAGSAGIAEEAADGLYSTHEISAVPRTVRRCAWTATGTRGPIHGRDIGFTVRDERAFGRACAQGTAENRH